MAAHRYWKIHVSANNEPGGWASVQMSELQFRAVAGGSPLTGTWTGTATAVPGDPTYDLANIHDGDFTTYYASQGGFVPVDTFVELDLGLGGDSIVLEVAIAPREAEENYAPRDFSISYSDDGVSWTVVRAFAGIASADWTDDTFKLFSIAPGEYISRMSQYVIEGSNRSTFVSRASQYVIEAYQRRQGTAVF